MPLAPKAEAGAGAARPLPAPPPPPPRERTGRGGAGGKDQLCIQSLQGNCTRGDQCRYSHAAAKIAAVRSAVVAGVAASQAAATQQQPAWQPAPYQPQAPPAGIGALGPPVAPPGMPVLQWIRPTDIGAVFPAGFVAATAVSRAPAAPVTGALRALSDLPAEAWTLVDEPPPGYNYSSQIEVAGAPVEVLLDGGAAFCLLLEELLVYIINKAIASGRTPESKDWPLAGLEYWGRNSVANTVAKGGDLPIFAVVLLRTTLVGIDGRWVEHVSALGLCGPAMVNGAD